MRERIEQQLGDDPDAEANHQRHLICRRCDDRPIGSVLLSFENERACTVRFTHDPNRSLDEHAAAEAEVMRFTLPFLIQQRRLMKATTDHMGDHPLVAQAAAELGMRRCYRLREAFQYQGTRVDRIGYELLNPRWVKRLGMPPAMREAPVERHWRDPAPLVWQPQAEPSPRAIIVGHRIELRAFEPDEGAIATRGFMHETEEFYPQGPPVRNPWSYGQRMASITRKDPPDQIRMAIVELGTGRLLGMVGVAQVDLFHGRGKVTIEIFEAPYRSKGYGGEAINLLHDYLFQRIGLHMTYAWVSEYNPRSLAATRKHGFREAGYFAWEDLSDDGYCGGYYMDLLASEWRAARR
jgi:RimJ/RimL family protein N-acetyltransferase